MTLFDAALQAWRNLSTVMDLKSHPASCLCYGCNLQRAVMDEVMRRASEATRPIREREAEAEHPSQGLMEMRLDAGTPSIEQLKNVEQALRLFSASSALGLSEKNSILSACDELKECVGKLDDLLAQPPDEEPMRCPTCGSVECCGLNCQPFQLPLLPTDAEARAKMHGMNCPASVMGHDDECTCGLQWRIAFETEREMHNAWRKRAEEAEARLVQPPATESGHHVCDESFLTDDDCACPCHKMTATEPPKIVPVKHGEFEEEDGQRMWPVEPAPSQPPAIGPNVYRDPDTGRESILGASTGQPPAHPWHLTKKGEQMLREGMEPPAPETGKELVEQVKHADEIYANGFCDAMKKKLAKKRAEGRGGWNNPAECAVEYLAELLIGHLSKKDLIDIGNFAMMLHFRIGGGEALAAEFAKVLGEAEARGIEKAARVCETEIQDYRNKGWVKSAYGCAQAILALIPSAQPAPEDKTGGGK